MLKNPLYCVLFSVFFLSILVPFVALILNDAYFD